MVIEDNPNDVFLVREGLRAHGLGGDLQVFEDGEAALSYVRQLDTDNSLSCPSLILCLSGRGGAPVIACLLPVIGPSLELACPVQMP